MRPEPVVAALWLSCVLVGAAHACFSPASIKTVFFDTISTPDDASVVLRIRVTRIEEPITRYTHDSDLPDGTYLARAEVLQVIKGAVDQSVITIVAPGSDCEDILKVGRTGIIAGRFRTSREGQLQLVLICIAYSHRILTAADRRNENELGICLGGDQAVERPA